MTELTPFADHRDHRDNALPVPGATRLRVIYLRACGWPVSTVAALSAGIAAYAAAAGYPAATVWLAAAEAAACTAIALIAGLYAAWAATRDLHDRISALRSRRAAQVAEGRTGPRMEVLDNLARRMQSLAHQGITLLDDLESGVEDPDLLKRLYAVDHLLTRMRRQAESLAVLGGATSLRQWARQVTMHEVLRAAVAEVEQYSRVKVVPPVDGVLAGAAVADVIHLIAELTENATRFSPPNTEVLLRAQPIPAGLVIEVEDRGLGMTVADRDRMNRLLADPAQVSVNQLLRDGRIGLYVVSTLAHHHGIKVQLAANIFRGIQAVIVIPAALASTGDAKPTLAQPVPGHEPPPESAAVGSGPPLPARHSTSPAAAPGSQPGLAAAAGPAGGCELPQGTATLPGDRPPLPKRTAQAHLAPGLRGIVATQRDEPADGPLPRLLADFQRGASRSGDNAPATGPGSVDRH